MRKTRQAAVDDPAQERPEADESDCTHQAKEVLGILYELDLPFVARQSPAEWHCF